MAPATARWRTATSAAAQWRTAPAATRSRTAASAAARWRTAAAVARWRTAAAAAQWRAEAGRGAVEGRAGGGGAVGAGGGGGGVVGAGGGGCTGSRVSITSRVCFSGLIGLPRSIGPKFRLIRLTEPNNRNDRNKFGVLRAGTE
uniref:Uncharacterized protein n=1 Tax=Oryza sativa subsp. japonica TaxID=39947 RepID=Q651M8_ORYSJ|nr:hypothetical protein [Oryza sativa Japonica Group]